MIFNRGLKPSRSLISTQLEQKGSWPSLLNGLITEKHDTNVQATRGITVKASTAASTKALVKLKKYRHDSIDRRKPSFNRFESCYRQLYPCRRVKTYRPRAISKNLKNVDDEQQISNFQRSQSMPNFQWPPLYKCKRRIQESRIGINLERRATRDLPSWLLPLYECKAKRSEPIGGNHPLRYSGVALHKKIEIKECMRRIKKQQVSLNQELSEKWSTYYDSLGKKPRDKRDCSSAKILLAVDELKRRIGKMHERNRIFRQTPYTPTAAQTTKKVVDENLAKLDSTLKEIYSYNSSQQVEEKIKIVKQSADQKDPTQSPKKLSTDVEDSSCTSCSQKKVAFNQNSTSCSKSNKGVDQQQGNAVNDVNSVVSDIRESKKPVQKNRNDLRANATSHFKEENKVDSNLDPSKLKERIRQWKLGTDKGSTSDSIDSSLGTKANCPLHHQENGSNRKGDTMHQKQSSRIEEDSLISYKPFIVCKTANKVGKRSLSSLPTFRVIPHKASSKGPFVVIKRNFSGRPKHFRGKGYWFSAIKLRPRTDNSSTAANEGAMAEKEKQNNAQESCEVPSEGAPKNEPESAVNENSKNPKEASSNKILKKSIDIEKKLRKASALVNSKPWPKDPKISTPSFKPHPLQCSASLPIVNDQQELVSGYQWVLTNREILEEIKHEKQLNCKRLVPEHVKASIQEFKLPLKARIADYRKRNDSKKVHGSLYNRSMHRRYYTTGKTRGQFLTNIPPNSDLLSLHDLFSINTRFLNTSTISNTLTSNGYQSNRSKSDPEILISSDLYKQYVLRPIYGSNPKNEKKVERHPCEFSSWAVTTAGSSRQRSTNDLQSSNLPYKHSDAPPSRSLKKQVEELKCLIKKNKISNHVAQATNYSKLPQQNDNYQQRLTRLIKAAEETAKHLEIPEPRRTSGPNVKVIHESKKPTSNTADIMASSALRQCDLDGGSSEISSQGTAPTRKQPVLDLVLKLKSFVDFVGGKALLPTKVHEKYPLPNETPKDMSDSRVLADGLRMSHSVKPITKVPSGPTQEEIATLQRILSEMNSTGKKPQENEKSIYQSNCSSSSENMTEKSKDLAAHVLVTNHHNVLKSQSTPAMTAPQSKPAVEVPPQSSLGSSTDFAQPMAAGSQQRPAVVCNSHSAFDFSRISGNLKTAYPNEDQATLSRNVIEKSTDSRCIENPYRQTSPSTLDLLSEFNRIEGPNNALPSPKNKGNRAQSNPVDEFYKTLHENSAQISPSSIHHAAEDNSRQPKVDLKQSLDGPITLEGLPMDNVKTPSGHREFTHSSNEVQSEGNTSRQTQITVDFKSQPAGSSQIPEDHSIKHDSESAHHPQESVKDNSLKQNTSYSQHQPLTRYGEVKNHFGYVPYGNVTQEQTSPVSTDRYFFDGVQYNCCQDCGRIYPVYCSCRKFQDVDLTQVKAEAVPDSRGFLSRYFPDEREMDWSSFTGNSESNRSFSQPFSRQHFQRNCSVKTGTKANFPKIVDDFENRSGNSYEGATYARRDGSCSEILDKEPFINPDALKKLKLPVNLGEELKETTWYNATNSFPRH